MGSQVPLAGVLGPGPGEETKTYNYHLHVLTSCSPSEIRSPGPRRGFQDGDDRSPRALGPAHTTQQAPPHWDPTGQDVTRHVAIRYDTRRKRTTPRTDLPTDLQQKDLALLHVRLAGPRMEDMLTPSGVRPLWAGGLRAGGLAAWQPGSLAYLGTYLAYHWVRRDRRCCHGRGTKHSSITMPSAGQLSGPHRRRCSHVPSPHATRCLALQRSAARSAYVSMSCCLSEIQCSSACAG